MFKFTKSFMAAALAVVSIGVSAQNSVSKSDLFGQDQPGSSSADNSQMVPAAGSSLALCSIGGTR
jgi:hypothetical protein